VSRTTMIRLTDMSETQPLIDEPAGAATILMV
jgi:hypothetical protein